jgi:ketosteroid isomerase-like protein
VSLQNVEIVRRINAAHEGRDVIGLMRQRLEPLGADPQPDAVLAMWADDPLVRHVHPDVEWESPLPGVATAHGTEDLLRWWGEWLEVWESYRLRILAYRDLGDWVMTVNEIRARGRDGMSLEMTNFQLWRVRDEKVATVRIFFDEPSAIEAARSED